MPAELRRELKTRANGRSVKVRKTVKDAASYIAAADVVVGMAGYNTTAEILRARTPAVLVPRSGPSAEQRMRAQLFSERDWVRVVDPDDLSPSRLAAAVVDALGDRSPEVVLGGPDLGGLGVAVGHLLSLLEAPARASSALLGV
jgi:predicted glycosyltransferase